MSVACWIEESIAPFWTWTDISPFFTILAETSGVEPIPGALEGAAEGTGPGTAAGTPNPVDPVVVLVVGAVPGWDTPRPEEAVPPPPPPPDPTSPLAEGPPLLRFWSC